MGEATFDHVNGLCSAKCRFWIKLQFNVTFSPFPPAELTFLMLK